MRYAPHRAIVSRSEHSDRYARGAIGRLPVSECVVGGQLSTMDGPRPAAAAQPPTDRIEGISGPAHAGATLTNYPTDRPTHNLDHTVGAQRLQQNPRTTDRVCTTRRGADQSNGWTPQFCPVSRRLAHQRPVRSTEGQGPLRLLHHKRLQDELLSRWKQTLPPPESATRVHRYARRRRSLALKQRTHPCLMQWWPRRQRL